MRRRPSLFLVFLCVSHAVGAQSDVFNAIEKLVHERLTRRLQFEVGGVSDGGVNADTVVDVEPAFTFTPIDDTFGPIFADGDFLCSFINDPNTQQSGNLVCSCFNNTLDCNSTEVSCYDGECFNTNVQLGFSSDLVAVFDRLCISFIDGTSKDQCLYVDYDESGSRPETCEVSFDGTTCNTCTVCPDTEVGYLVVDLDCNNTEPLANTNGTCTRVQEIETFQWMDATSGVWAVRVTGTLLMAFLASALLS